MVYRITVDGVRKYAEASIKEYSLKADNIAREGIIRHYLDKKGASEVTFDTTQDEAYQLHLLAKEFHDQVAELCRVYEGLPDSPWGTDEMALLIPELMKIYILGMKLPDPEYMEDAEYECGDLSIRGANFSDKYDYYWEVFDPYWDIAKKPNKDFGKAIHFWLTDDIVSVINDLMDGEEAYHAGLVCEAVFQWRWGLLNHYGHHLLGALRAMCTIWAKEAEYWDSPKDYWDYGFDGSAEF